MPGAVLNKFYAGNRPASSGAGGNASSQPPSAVLPIKVALPAFSCLSCTHRAVAVAAGHVQAPVGTTCVLPQSIPGHHKDAMMMVLAGMIL